MAISDFAKQYHEKMFPGCVSEFAETDSEFIERFDSFAFDDVINMPPDVDGKAVDGRTRHMAILATFLGCHGIDKFKVAVYLSRLTGICSGISGPGQIYKRRLQNRNRLNKS
ncbi:MAG: hypothetical protein J1F64_11520 [Oscillospiraceae bacterium]|nr:hypothetical protein [Oscillospiraceae bacterium]